MGELWNMLGNTIRCCKSLRRGKLRLFGHGESERKPLQKILEGKVEEVRSRGRIVRHWLDNVKEWTWLSLNEIRCGLEKACQSCRFNELNCLWEKIQDLNAIKRELFFTILGTGNND